MSQKIRILISESTNPWFNLATEDWIFRELEADTHVLFLWRNQETVVIGRHQNPWVECKTEKMAEDKVYLARRQSGGGAVFHDLGNTNFTFLSPSQGYDQDANFSIIINALNTLGIEAYASGRNDLLVDELKVSGSAFKHAKDRSFHHGTLLINANMSKLADYLNPHPLKLQAKGIQSVRARVANLVEFNQALDHQTVCKAIIDSFSQHYNAHADIETLDQETLEQNEHLKKYYDLMADWDWRFGKTPNFTHSLESRFDWGLINIKLNVKQAQIEEVNIYSDALDVEFIQQLHSILLDCKYSFEALNKIITEHQTEYPQWINELQDIQQWLASEIK